jgi:dTDP-glucose 4,6-dehydratase
MERLLVTGGAGFIGSAFVRHVLDQEPETRVVTYDALTYAGHPENLRGLPRAEQHHLVVADVADAKALGRAFQEHAPTAVVHLAAETHVDRSHDDALRFVRTNVLGTQCVLDACHRAGIRMLHVSTDEVYGSVKAPKKSLPSDPLRPTSSYAASKASADLLALAAQQTRGQDVILARCTNNYGPRQTPEKLIPLMITRALRGEELPVYGDGLQVRDWIHVEDHVRGLLLALRKGRPGAVYHFAGRSPHRNIDVVHAIVDLAGASRKLVRHVGDRPRHDRRYALEDRQTRKELAFEPQVPFDQGLADTVEWYRRNETWVETVCGPALAAFLTKNYAGRGVLGR